MAVDKLVDSTQLDSDLTSVANAIRTKGGTSGSLAFPAGFVSAVQAIPTGTTPTGTKQISITANGTTTEDVAAYANAEITVNVSGGGGGSNIAEFNNCLGSTTKWITQMMPSNTLSSGGSLEVEFYDPSPATDFGNIIDFGNVSGLAIWNNQNAIHIYHDYKPNNNIDRISVAYAGTQYLSANMDSSVPHTIKIDSDYIYLDDVSVVATPALIIAATDLTFGSQEGSKRFQGTYKSIIYK